ncbi:ClpP family protease [Sporosarcina sp. FSL W7-1283]|uniref:ClpP family protease n=1 Tax=Sporosarcina sp. FSL W7-1283 TaxID=2921560 RepID=UPI0030F9B71A
MSEEKKDVVEDIEEEIADVESVEDGNIEAEDERETVVVYLDELEKLSELVDELENDENIEDKIDRTLFDERVIYLQGTISTDTVNQVVPMIHFYNIQDSKNNIPIEKRKNIQIYISSVGGEMTHGKNILAAMEASEAKIETILQGSMGASMGMVLFLGGDIRKMSRHAEMLYHNLSAGMEGTYSEMKNQFAYYDRLQKEMDKYIVERTDIPMKKLKRYSERNLDWYMSFEECKKYNVFHIEI